MFKVCIQKRNVCIGPSRWLFVRRHVMRFEWIALLALRKATSAPYESWVTVDDIARLPGWAGKTPHHVATNVGRYLQALEQEGLTFIEERSRWAGPYRLRVASSAITFDSTIEELAKRLRLKRQDRGIDSEQLLRFTFSYVRAQWLMFHGRLVVSQTDPRSTDTAYERLLRLAGDSDYTSRLRLMACLAAVRVLFRLGRFQAARKTLNANTRLVMAADDQVLSAQYHLALAWSHTRGSSGGVSNRKVEKALSAAREYAEDSGDRASIGLLAYYKSMYLTKKGKHGESFEQLFQSVEAALVTGNYDAVQAHCGDLGSVMHRIGPKCYQDARLWLLLGIAVARWMKIGRDDAHGEMILGKIYTELGKQPRLARFWLQRAERIAAQSGNQVNLADVRMVSGFWYQRFGTRKAHVETLAQALRIFRSLRDFDCRQKERYMARKFPSVWPEVIALVDANRSL